MPTWTPYINAYDGIKIHSKYNSKLFKRLTSLEYKVDFKNL